MVIFMEKKEKQEFLPATRAEIRQLFGFFEERMNDKFKLIFEAFENIYKTLDKHTEMFEAFEARFDTKAEVTELDSLDRRVTKLERKEAGPSRSG